MAQQVKACYPSQITTVQSLEPKVEEMKELPKISLSPPHAGHSIEMPIFVNTCICTHTRTNNNYHNNH